MPNLFTATGGARVGWLNASWPLAKLSAAPEKLTLAVRLLGTYHFSPDQVSAVTRYVVIPVMGWGVRIHHCNPDCPARVIFWCLGNPNVVLQGIHNSGFQPLASIAATSQRRGIPIRWSAIIAALILWNGPFLLDGSFFHPFPPRPGPFLLAPLIFAFVISLGTLISPQLQTLVLKPGRRIVEIKPLLRLLVLVSGILLVAFSILIASGALDPTD